MSKSTKFLTLLACTANLAVLPSVGASTPSTPSIASLSSTALSTVTPSTPKSGATFTISAYENMMSLEAATKVDKTVKPRP